MKLTTRMQECSTWLGRVLSHQLTRHISATEPPETEIATLKDITYADIECNFGIVRVRDQTLAWSVCIRIGSVCRNESMTPVQIAGTIFLLSPHF